MNIPLVYGLLMAVVGALLNFGQFFAGYHDTPEKIKSVQWVAGTIGFAAAFTLLFLAMKTRRQEYPAEREWGYGAAFGTGVLTGLWAALFGAVFSYLYFGIVNPQFQDVMYQVQLQAAEAKGVSAADAAQAEGIMRKMLSPPVMTVVQAFLGFIMSALLSLIVAIFVRKPLAPAEPPAISPTGA